VTLEHREANLSPTFIAGRKQTIEFRTELVSIEDGRESLNGFIRPARGDHVLEASSWEGMAIDSGRTSGVWTGSSFGPPMNGTCG
jgi:hypothetical protein